jgi:hypothetical protein
MLPEYSGRVLEMAEALGLPQGVAAEFALQLGEEGCNFRRSVRMHAGRYALISLKGPSRIADCMAVAAAR